MAKNELEKALELVDCEIKKAGISRREAFKLAGLGSAAYLMGGSESNAATELKASEASGKILIIGGGLAGISTAARLATRLSNPDITIVEPNPKSVLIKQGVHYLQLDFIQKQTLIITQKIFYQVE